MNWSDIRAHYRRHLNEIEAAPRNEWAIDAYAWDGLLELTPIEKWLWADIRQLDAVLYPQFPVGRFFVDFASPVARVAIECDGAAFHQDKAKDAARDAELERMGWTVYRITGTDCRTEQDADTGRSSAAYEFIKQIAERHRIRRGHGA
jgi:very-short-patch-repair endonuclease